MIIHTDLVEVRERIREDLGKDETEELMASFNQSSSVPETMVSTS